MRIFKWGIIVTGVAVITAFAAGYFYLRSTLPDYNRSLILPGVSQEVEIIRDSFGMAHIRAVDDADHGELVRGWGCTLRALQPRDLISPI